MSHTPKAPAFQFYARDWLSSASVTVMSTAAEGAYIRLLAHHWLAGQLPSDVQQIRRLTKCGPREFAKLWPELEPHFPVSAENPQVRVNPKLAAQRAEDDAYRASRSADGRKGAAKRWLSDGSANGSAMATPIANDSSAPASASASALEDQKQLRPDVQKAARRAATNGERPKLADGWTNAAGQLHDFLRDRCRTLIDPKVIAKDANLAARQYPRAVVEAALLEYDSHRALAGKPFTFKYFVADLPAIVKLLDLPDDDPRRTRYRDGKPLL